MSVSFICRCKVSGHLRLSPRGTYFPCNGDALIPYAFPASKLELSPSCMVWVSISNLSVKIVKYLWLSDHFALDSFSKISLNISSFVEHLSICLFPILLAVSLGIILFPSRLACKENFISNNSRLHFPQCFFLVCVCIHACVHVCTCVHVFLCAHIHVCVCVCILVYVCLIESVYVLGCLYACVSVGMHLPSLLLSQIMNSNLGRGIGTSRNWEWEVIGQVQVSFFAFCLVSPFLFTASYSSWPMSFFGFPFLPPMLP